MRLSSDARARVGGLVLLAVVVGGATLLLAGYGVPVGVGLLLGLALGFVAGLVGTLWLGAGTGRSVSVFGTSWSTDRPEGVLAAEMEELGHVFGVDLGEVRQVIAVLSTSEASGIVVTLLSVELYEGGLSAQLVVRARPGAAPPGWLARASLEDDVGTSYRAAGQFGGGGPGAMRLAVIANPAVPPGVDRLRLLISRFDTPDLGTSPSVEGPWTFEVQLGE